MWKSDLRKYLKLVEKRWLRILAKLQRSSFVPGQVKASAPPVRSGNTLGVEKGRSVLDESTADFQSLLDETEVDVESIRYLCQQAKLDFCEVIGQGSNATVARCFRTVIKRDGSKLFTEVAAKFFFDQVIEYIDSSREVIPAITQPSVLNEIGVLKALEGHENAVQLRRIEHFPGAVLLELSYCQVGDLERYVHLHKRCPLPEDVVKVIMYDCLILIRYMHSMGIVHRDLKPSNIYIDQDGNSVIGDFGTAKNFDLLRGKKKITLVGTLMYRSPELLMGVTDYGKEVDLFAIGAIMAQLLCYEPLFRPWITEKDVENEPKKASLQMAEIMKVMGAPKAEDVKFSAFPRYLEVHKELKSNQQYDGKNHMKEKIFELIRKHTDHVPYIKKRKISEDCFDLLHNLLKFDQKERVSASEALKHRWFDGFRLFRSDEVENRKVKKFVLGLEEIDPYEYRDSDLELFRRKRIKKSKKVGFSAPAKIE